MSDLSLSYINGLREENLMGQLTPPTAVKGGTLALPSLPLPSLLSSLAPQSVVCPDET